MSIFGGQNSGEVIIMERIMVVLDDFLWFNVVLAGFEVFFGYWWFMVVLRSSGWFSVVHGGSW